MFSMQAMFWKAFYSKWRAGCAQPAPGYTILLPVPGDLPVFLELALHVCGRLNPEGLVETLVLPDNYTPACPEIVERVRKTWANGPIRLVKLRWLDRQVTRLKKPHANHWLQLVNGVENTRSTHALLHDADLFIFDRDCVKRQFETCSSRRLACLGVSPVWDEWFKKQGFQLTGTWELMFEVDWLKSFKPYLHIGHDNVINGERHTFDTTLFPQCQTKPERIDFQPVEGGLVHFNYVISTYRFFQKSQGPYEDNFFRLLLVRLLIDVFDHSNWPYEAPPLGELEKGLTDASRRVTYGGKETAGHYPEFRGKLQELMNSPLLQDQQAQLLRDGVRPFDKAFGWSGG